MISRGRISFIAFIFLSFFFCTRLTAQDSTAIDSWLKKNSTPFTLSLDSTNNSLQPFDDEVKSKQVFFAGEYHDHAADYELKLQLIFHLYRNAGVRLIVEERPYSVMYMLDHLMMLGQKKAFDDYAYWVSNTVKERVYYSTIYEFNQNLPASERIRLRGAAEEQIDRYAMRSLDTLFKNKSASPALRSRFYEVRNLTGISLKSSLEKLHGLWLADSTFSRQMGDDYNKVEIILRNYACKKCDPQVMSVSELSERENLIYQNYLKILSEFPGAKTYSQFGTLHTCLQPESDWYWLSKWTPVASRLNTNPESPVRGKVGNIVFLFHELYYQPQFFPTKKMHDYIWNYQRGDLTLIRFSGEGSPYNTAEDSLAERLHYMLLINYDWEKEKEWNSKAVNDPYDVFTDHSYLCSGFFGSVQIGQQTPTVEIGVMVAGRDLQRPLYPVSAGFSFEWDTRTDVQHFRAGMSAGGIVIAHASIFAATNYSRTGWYFRPELGLNYAWFQLTAGYNVKLADRYLSDQINKGVLSLRFFIPMRRQP